MLNCAHCDSDALVNVSGPGSIQMYCCRDCNLLTCQHNESGDTWAGDLTMWEKQVARQQFNSASCNCGASPENTRYGIHGVKCSIFPADK